MFDRPFSLVLFCWFIVIELLLSIKANKSRISRQEE